MKKLLVLLVLLAGMWQGAAGQFQLLWYKQVPNTVSITDVQFSHNSQWLLCETGGEFNIIYDSATGVILKDSIPPMGYPFFSIDDSHLIGINDRKPVNLNLTTFQDESTADPSDRSINIGSISTDGKYYLGIVNDSDYIGFRIWDLQTGKIIKTKDLYRPYDHKKIDSTSFDGSIDEIALNCDNSQIYVKQFCVLSKLLYVDSKGNPHYDSKMSMKVNVYDFNTMDSIRCLYDQPVMAYFRKFQISHNCQYIAFAFQASSNPIIIYDINTMQPISTLNFYGVSRTNIKFTSDDKYLVVAQGTGGENLSIWDVTTGKLLGERPGGDYDNIDISNNQLLLAVSGGDQIGILKSPILGITQPPEIQEILYPNPTTGELSLKITLPALSFLTATLNDLNGAFIANVYQQYAEQGTNIIRIDVSPYSSGTYFLKLNAVGFEKIYKLIIVK